MQGLPWAAEEAEVRAFFDACGAIGACELPLGADGRASGTALVTMATSDGYDKALAMDGEYFGESGRWLKVRDAASRPSPRSPAGVPGEKPEGCVSCFIGNLAWTVDEDAVREAFAECGEVVAVRFATDRETGDFKGFGHVDFATTEATEAAVALAGTEVAGRAIRVDYALPRAPRGDGGKGWRRKGGGGRGRRQGRRRRRGGGKAAARAAGWRQGRQGRGGKGAMDPAKMKNTGSIPRGMASSDSKIAIEREPRATRRHTCEAPPVRDTRRRALRAPVRRGHRPS